MRTLLPRIGRIGVDDSLSTSDAKRVALTNHVAAGMSVVSLAGVAVFAFFPAPAVVPGVMALAAVGFSMVLLLNRTGHRRAARRWLGVLAIALAAFLTVEFGERSGAGDYLLLIAVATWLFWRRDEWRFPARVTAVALAANLALSLFADRLPPPRLPESLLPAFELVVRIFLYAMMLLLGLAVFFQTHNAEEQLEIERRKSERLLRNILPARIADRLKQSSEAIADRFDEATVLFADIVNFTVLAERVPAPELVRLLDEVFTSFDRLADVHGLEKIKTIGDAYMVAAGIPEPRADHVEAVARMALEMPAALAAIPGAAGLQVRIGIHTGPVVAGVIGKRKFAYDLWGDTVNTASRMESHGAPGKVHVTEAVFERLGDRYAFEPRGSIAVKGKGELCTYFLVGPSASAAHDAGPRSLPLEAPG